VYKREEVKREWSKPRCEVLNDMNSSPNVVSYTVVSYLLYTGVTYSTQAELIRNVICNDYWHMKGRNIQVHLYENFYI
jgi:hypothetical protein